MRLVDLLLNQDLRPPQSGRTLPKRVAKGVRSHVIRSKVVEATNVYAYCKAQNKPTPLYELPCGAPPHDEMLVEWMQNNGQRLGVLALARKGPFRIGVQEESPRVGENRYRWLLPPANSLNPDAPVHPVHMWLSDNMPDQAAWDPIEWIWGGGVFQEHDGHPYGPLATISAALDQWGRLVDVVWELGLNLPPGEDHAPFTLHPFQVFMTTINFMQCANIKTVYVTPPEQLSKKHRKHGHLKPSQSLASYNVLKLAQSGPATRVRGARNSPTGLVGFHPVRGEFHHYGDCCPGAHPPKGLLFGKLTGRYWVPAHTRGNPERGSIDHSFEIGPE